ncbi:MAG: hypothetical protein AAF471_02095 [Myxococcota bacterium]
MMHWHGRANATPGQPITLRCVTRSDTGVLTDPPSPRSWRVHAVPDTDPKFDAKQHTLYTAPADKIQRIRTGVYETMIPTGICTKPGTYHDVLRVAPRTEPSPTKARHATGERRNISRQTADFSCYRDSFSLREHAPPLVGYASIDRVRRQDPQLADDKAFPDDAVNEAVAAASSLLERWTGRWFAARRQTLLLDGSGTRFLPLPQPLLHLERLRPFFDAERPFSRLLDGRDREPWEAGDRLEASDWDNPRLVGPFFPRGRRNILIQGLFGTVNEEGETPAAVAQAAARLAARDLLRGSSLGPDTGAGPVVGEHTDGHSYQLAVSAATQQACFSGDPAIDAVVAAHKRPVVMGTGV